MLNMTPAAILAPPPQRPLCLTPCLGQGNPAPTSLLRAKRGRGGWRWEEDSFFHHQKGFLDFLPLPVALALV